MYYTLGQCLVLLLWSFSYMLYFSSESEIVSFVWLIYRIDGNASQEQFILGGTHYVPDLSFCLLTHRMLTQVG